jgi:hypothetical protein
MEQRSMGTMRRLEVHSEQEARQRGPMRISRAVLRCSVAGLHAV